MGKLKQNYRKHQKTSRNIENLQNFEGGQPMGNIKNIEKQSETVGNIDEL